MARIAIIGGGISGLSLAYFILEKAPSSEIMVFESDKRAGGKIWTEKADGFLFEGGVNGFLDNRPKTLELSEKICLKPLRSNDASRKRFIYSEGRLHRLPESPQAFLSSGLLSVSGRLRVMAEAIIPGNAKEEETLAAFSVRRLGREAYEKLIDPMASGIYAGNPENLSLRACFPKVYDLEKNYGGLIRGMFKLKKQKKEQGSNEKVGAGPGGVLTSFYNGMGEITDSLQNILGSKLRLGHKIVSLDKKRDKYSVILQDGSNIEADIVTIASPAYSASEMLRSLDKRLSGIIAEIPYPSLSVVCFGYTKETFNFPLDGFGFLIPSREKRRILGNLWDSSIFPNRAPEGHVLLRSMIGGARASELAMENDSRLSDIVKEEAEKIMGIKSEPDLIRIYRHEKAIPQYTPGHPERLRNIDSLLMKHKNLFLTGNAYRGIGVNDCIENSYRLAEKIIEES
ncbi:MAG: protoporphyrinogen oxidase [Nitrospirae bacterium GWC2_42_7]|nr:MAG: protoporphyrinogen oxidase [Nitrospirae bacterium GWC2_42_7]